MNGSKSSLYDMARMMDDSGLIIGEIVKSIGEERDVEPFVKLAFNYALKNKTSLHQLLERLQCESLYSEQTQAYITDMIRQLSTSRYFKEGDENRVEYLVVLPIVIKSHFGSNQECVVLPPIIRNNLASTLERFFAENGMHCDVEVEDKMFNYVDYSPSISDYVEYSKYLQSICRDDAFTIANEHHLFMIPMRVSLKRDNESHFFDNGESFNIASTYKAFESYQDDIRCLVQFIFKASKYNVSVINPMLANEALWGALSFVRIEKCLYDIAKQAIIARPMDYKVIITSCQVTGKIRVCFYIENENFYAFDYGKPINLDHQNVARDVDHIQYFLSKYGFDVVLSEREVEGSLTEELSRTLLRVT